MNKWLTHVKTVFQKGKKKNPDYTYTQALQDAKASYKKDPHSAHKQKMRKEKFFKSKKDKK